MFDIPDLHARTKDLVAFIAAAAARYGFDASKVIAAGFSNGANIAASCLLLRPGILSDAILFRPMVPLVPDPLPELSSKHILISAGLHDPIVQRQETENLLSLLKKTGADVSIIWQNSGHELILEEIRKAKDWLLSVLAINNENIYQ